MSRAIGQSWGRYPRVEQRIIPVLDRNGALPLPSDGGTVLAHGNGRSYGDSCLNPGATLLTSRGLDRFIDFDPATGIVSCEAGVTLADILDIALPRGWFLPVTPGTRYATVGGAIGNDVHGKNHHRAGTFCHHVRCIELLRSDGSRQQLTPTDSSGLFAATAGGLGLTGFITWVELQLRRVPGPWIETESIRFDNLDEFFELSRDSAEGFEYTVAWIDCLAKGANLGRGHFLRGDHAPGDAQAATPSSAPRRSMPLVPPVSLVNRLTLRPFNTLYYWRQPARHARQISHYQSYFYPLDGINHWNRMYGPRGFLQHQCVLPPATARDATAALLAEIARSGRGSFLAVLKEFGDRPSPGLMSFPRPGTTLALDFPNDGPDLLKMLDRLDRIVSDAGGAVYPAKDARMSGALFRQAYPAWEAFSRFIDPRFSSGFWRRVME
ncbi:MAG: linked oxidase domain protein [Stenotrophomonas indicatrix]|jgi:FAD/FMN-containing dehydrogenase|uniref:FAD-binding oxidoreductase n=1 Tax=Stenotrophomonas indicatrix TaxID=2045451 RepID=UPI00092A398F|nr:FAD-binding oxidoreductase [Stenotrophomonas indicatrix]MDF2481242.1 linked oxidase domain protein [Stenotrophomonas indicatrix]OJH78145.1 MAG: FAD-binding oxidoreductase [Stenotrophomonas maltophilia]